MIGQGSGIGNGMEQPQVLEAFPKEGRELLAKVEIGEGDAPFPAAYIGRSRPDHLSKLLLRPGALYPFGLQELRKLLHRAKILFLYCLFFKIR